MSNSKVVKFNTIIGNSPASLEEKEKFWKQATLQAKLILEEAKEQYDACLQRDLVEVVDGACDVRYLQDYMNTLLDNVGVDLEHAFDMVCYNNDQKYTRNYNLALESATSHTIEGGVPSEVEEVEYEGDLYYVVKRKSDGKVMKLLGHQPPDIAAAIPSQTAEVLGDVML